MSASDIDSTSLPNRLLLRRLLRYREWLVSGSGFTMEQALQELEVCQRTVYRDMDYVRAALGEQHLGHARRIAEPGPAGQHGAFGGGLEQRRFRRRGPIVCVPDERDVVQANAGKRKKGGCCKRRGQKEYGLARGQVAA